MPFFLGNTLYEMLLAPPYNRTLIMAWEDACWDESWGSVGDHLVLQQWNQGAWRSDTCTVLTTNASVVVSGPFSVGETTTPSQNLTKSESESLKILCMVRNQL
jgi:hypothetical protein